MERLSDPYFYPLYSALAYYSAVFAIGELARFLVTKYVSPRGNSQLFAIELIGTIQMCTCVYENGIIVKNYGLNAFFIVVGLLLTAGGIFNRGALTNCVPIIEDFFYSACSSSKFLAILTAQLIGASFASKCAYFIWNWTSQYSQSHLENALNTTCILQYKQSAGIVIAFEIFGAFAMRILIAKIAARPSLRKTIPFVVSLYLTAALYIIGVPGLNPIVATARLFGCQGIDNHVFVILYWICPVVGWLGGAHFVRNSAVTPVKKSSKKSKKN
ncbi:unnamed protein product [Caenorhabditis angaria]|uniref:Aquaporin n=1 Tax=Caenorhabditis angaria TaxID=860376 RepID=A0A9P1I8Z9_9PELO|nr:unnamed protein product [Caenorhabditis angaria]